MRCLFLAIFLLANLSAAPASQPSSIDEKCNSLLARWKTRFSEAHFNYVVCPPFVIAGNGDAARIVQYRDGTILPSARALEHLYFKTAPSEPILILLFESEGPYRRLAGDWFDDHDVPHFGFYQPANHVMLMNVSTGTGTLVHELTHALMAPDFPAVPDWFNEGLASLYEQSTVGVDSIKGLPNWRLPALQKAIQDSTLRPTRELIDDPEFRSPDRVGLNYAHARYVLLYLQEQGKLQTYYRRFRDAARDDPHGLETFKQLIAPQSIDDFDTEWRRWVLELRFP